MLNELQCHALLEHAHSGMPEAVMGANMLSVYEHVLVHVANKCVLVMLDSDCAAQLYFTRVRRAMSGEGGVFVMVRVSLKP